MILKADAEKKFNTIGVAWGLSVYLFGYCLLALDIDFSACSVCEALSQYLPAIDVMSEGSMHQETMKYVWLYVYLTIPVLIAVMFNSVRDFNSRVLKKDALISFFLLGLFGLYVLIFGISFGGFEAEGRLGKLYYKYLFSSIMVAFSFGIIVVGAVFFIGNHILANLEKE